MTKRFSSADLAASLEKQGLEVGFKYRANPKKSPGPSESEIQQEVIAWWEEYSNKIVGVPPYLLFAVPLQAARTPRNGARMKREGARVGTPDLFLMLRRGGYGALAIEMKKPKGIVSDEQTCFLRSLRFQGYLSAVCFSAEEAKKTITDYITSK